MKSRIVSALGLLLVVGILQGAEEASAFNVARPGPSKTWKPLGASTLNDGQKSKIGKDDDDDKNAKSSSRSSQAGSFGDRIAGSGMASAAAMATAAVNAAVSMKTLEAPDVTKSYIAMDRNSTELDGDGLPLVYDKDLIEAYWAKERGALNKRWGVFVGKAVPFFTKLTTLFIRDGKIAESEIPDLSRRARIDLQELGPTFIKVRCLTSGKKPQHFRTTISHSLYFSPGGANDVDQA